MATPMTPTSVLRHRWIRHTIEAVDVIVDPRNGAPYSVAKPAPQLGMVTGCEACGEPLTTSTASTNCSGEDIV